MLSCLLLCVLLAMTRFPETPAAQWCARALAATGAAVRRIERKHVVFAVLMTIILVAGTEVLAIAGPFDMALVLMWDVSVFVDALLAAGTIAAVARGRSGWRYVLQRFAPRARTGRRQKRTSARPAVHADNDDDRRGWAAAA